jgi:hypothetical protein
MLYALFHAVYLALFFDKGKKAYLLISSFFLLVEILSFRRSALFVAVVADSFLFVFYFFSTRMRNRIGILSVITALVLATQLVLYLSPEAALYADRYLGAFTNARGNSSYGSDSGHIEQTILTTIGASEIGFWGLGYGKNIELIGAYEGNLIHNAFAGMWAKYGMFVLYYYGFLFLVVLRKLILTITNFKRFRGGYGNVLGICTVFYLTYFIAMCFAPSTYIESPKMFSFLTLLFCFIYRYLYTDNWDRRPSTNQSPATSV